MITFFQFVSEKKEAGLYLFLVPLLFLASCSGSKKLPDSSQVSTPVGEVTVLGSDSTAFDLPVFDQEDTVLPTKIIYDDRNLFVEPVSNYDVLSTKLDISFDFPRQRVIGVAEHRLQVTSDVLGRVRLNGRDMAINEVLAREGKNEFQTANYQYQDNLLTIQLNAPAKRGDTVDVQIAYVADPRRNNSNLGLVFVDPLEIDPSRPTQVWTLGQPEDNRYWFPAWDYPNDRMTFELVLTVPEKYTTAANGQLIDQESLNGGLRKDRWVLDKPHPAYLTGFAVGEFTTVQDVYLRDDGSRVPLTYYVEPEQALNATLVFGETPDILGFFERKLGIAYPWDNYKQICVRDFTARGMENTSATLMYDKLQRDERAHLDNTGVGLITHEIAHQWFGNLLTCRNWAHLPLNEGFASYFERLYKEEAYGLGDGQMHTINERNEYLQEANELMRPVIWFNYQDPYELYDKHTYQKSALILHQMRNELGEDVWWRGVRKYVRDNSFQQVVLEDLQQAMQEAAGKPLGGFFNQWYRRPGHPVLEVTHTYDRNRGLYGVQVVQTQDSIAIGNFAFDVDIEVNLQGFEPFIQRYRVASRDTTFHFAIASAISFVRFDAGDWLLADIEVEKELVEWLNQMRLDDEMAGRFDATLALADFEPDERIRDELLQAVRSDSSPHVRKAAANVLSGYIQSDVVRAELLGVVQGDSDSAVRQQALLALNSEESDQLKMALDIALLDRSYQVVSTAIDIYADRYPEQFAAAVRPLFEVESWQQTIEVALIKGYGKVRSLEGIPYLERHLDPLFNEEVQVAAIEALSFIATEHTGVRNSILELLIVSLDSIHEPVRYAAARSMYPLRGARTGEVANRKMASEQSSRVQDALRQLIVQ